MVDELEVRDYRLYCKNCGHRFMHPRREKEIQRQIQKLVYYTRQFNIPKSQRVDEVEKKIIVQPDPNAADADYSAFRLEVRRIIEEVVDKDTD